MSTSEILFSFSGRISRQTYWMGILYIFVATFVLAFFAGIIGAVLQGGRPSSGSGAAIFVFPVYVFMIWCSLAVAVKRWHDRGKSGLWVLIHFVPFLGWLWALVELGFLEGTPGPNKFGEEGC
jgi:uncharacterized membrane protein YhaH (DUF805 family)